MLMITRSEEAGTTTLALSGRVGSEHVPELRRLLEEEHGQPVVLDLAEVTLVDVDVVRFLIERHAQAIRLAQCPGYVREWMVREKQALEDQMSHTSAQGVRNVVLVHGGFVDGSGWQRVYNALRKDGYDVSVVQNPTTSLADDVAVTRRALAAQSGPAILVGHSYGGAVITEAGTDPKVAGLVYIAAFAPDKGESVSTLIGNPAPGAPVPPILPPQDGFLFLDRAKFQASFAADVAGDTAAFMADSQVPWGVQALEGAVSEPAWRTKPSWYLVTTEDRMIPPDAQRAMSKRAGSTVVEAKGSHSIYVSQPKAVADLIVTAAAAVAMAAR
jgi:pimeloyl-ACP methyl ester carboxylesterase